jgi:universal stress protein A
MFKNILVPSDLSEKKDKALNIAVKLASHDNGQVYLLHVIETLADTTYDELGDFYKELEKRVHRDMTALTQAFENEQQVNILPQIVFGNRAAMILKAVEAYQIDLIIMKSHRIDPNDPSQGWGTISYKVGILSACPVMLVK